MMSSKTFQLIETLASRDDIPIYKNLELCPESTNLPMSGRSGCTYTMVLGLGVPLKVPSRSTRVFQEASRKAQLLQRLLSG